MLIFDALLTSLNASLPQCVLLHAKPMTTIIYLCIDFIPATSKTFAVISLFHLYVRPMKVFIIYALAIE